MSLGAKEVILSEAAALALEGLEGSAEATTKSLVRRIHALKSILLADCLCGEVVKQPRIPKVLLAKYPLGNLYVEDLPAFWRLLYTIVNKHGDRYVIVVEIVDHRKYDKWFPNRGR